MKIKVKIGDLTKIRTGKLDANASSEDGQYPFFTCSREPLKISTYSYDCECVLVAGNGDLNVKYYNGKFDAYQRTYIIVDNGSGKLFMPYLYYFMEGYIEELRKQAIGGVIKYIKLGNLTDALITLPSIEEQKAIVDILEKARSVLNIRTAEICKLDELIKARFVEMFVSQESPKWNEVTISDLCSDMRTGPFGSALHHDEFVESGVFVLGIDNAVENKFSYNMMRYITEEKYQKLKRYTVYPRDVIITIMGTIGRSAVIPDNMPKAINTKHLACLTINNKANPYFVCLAFQIHPEIRMQLQGNKKGAIMDGLNLTIIKGLKFKLPPIELQNQFIDFFHQVDKLKVEVQKSLDETHLLFDSLMQKYFG